MQKHFVLKEITDDKPVKQWARELMGTRHEEAVESIKRENVSEEQVFSLELNGKKYLAFYMVGEMLPADMSMEVNQKHKEVMNLVSVQNIEGELLYSLKDNSI